MADIHRLKSEDTLGREASMWLARLNVDHVSSEERKSFEAWRKSDPRHERAWAETMAVWRQMLGTAELTRAVNTGQTFNAITERAIHRSIQARTRGRRIAVAAAAVVAVAAGVAWWAQTSAPKTQFQTAIGEHSTIKLPDGSTLDLNSNSRASVTYTSQARVIRLERGEAYFDVQDDPLRPFWVVAGKSWVGAVGTAFNVDLRTRLVRVTVSEGAVNVAPHVPSPAPPQQGRGEVWMSLVKAGQQADVQAAATEVRSLAPDQLTRSLSWREGSIYFEKERLADVVEELGRYTPDKIVIEDESLRDFRVGGTFETNAQGAEVLLANFEQGFGLQVRREGERVYVGRKK